MAIKSCEDCSNKFTYADSFKAAWGLGIVQCDNCNTKYIMGNGWRLLTYVLLILPLILQSFLKNYLKSATLVVIMVYLVTVLIVVPLLTSFNRKLN